MSKPDFIEQNNAFLKRCEEELRDADQRGFTLTLELNFTSLIALVANVHLALRHPSNTGPCAEISRAILSQITESLKKAGLHANAEMILLGADPHYDRPV